MGGGVDSATTSSPTASQEWVEGLLGKPGMDSSDENPLLSRGTEPSPNPPVTKEMRDWARDHLPGEFNLRILALQFFLSRQEDSDICLQILQV